jgi:hypothetical protein
MSETDKNRQAFEKWSNRYGLSCILYPSLPEYNDGRTRNAWKAWQAREPEIAELKARLKVAEGHGVLLGMAIVAGNAVRYENWYPDQILGGVTVADMQSAGAEDCDIKPIRHALLDRGKNSQAKKLSKKALRACDLNQKWENENEG